MAPPYSGQPPVQDLGTSSWGNSSQIAKMRADFKTAQRTLRTSNSTLHVVAVNGCCYGKDRKPDKGDYQKYCGQQFWEFISGEPKLYTDLIEPLGHQAKQRTEEFDKEHARMLNRFTAEFSDEFCTAAGDIDWEKLVKFNSQASK